MNRWKALWKKKKCQSIGSNQGEELQKELGQAVTCLSESMPILTLHMWWQCMFYFDWR